MATLVPTMRQTFTKFRSTPEEHRAFLTLASARGQTLSELIRFLLGNEIRKQRELSQRRKQEAR